MAEELRHTLDLEAPAPDQTDLDEMRRRMVRLALEGLGDSHREVIGLYYTGEMSYADIAAFLAISPTAVQGRLQRARDKLKKELKMVEERFIEEELPEDFSAEVARLLAAATTDKEQQTIDQLRQIGAPAVDPLCQTLEDPDNPAIRIAALALCAIGDERALHPLLRLLYSNQVDIFHQRDEEGRAWPGDWLSIGRLFAVPGLREKMLERVRAPLAEKQDVMRARQADWAEVMALGYAQGDDEVYEAVYSLFNEERVPNLKANALVSLCRIRPEAAEELIVRMLNRDQSYRSPS